MRGRFYDELEGVRTENGFPVSAQLQSLVGGSSFPSPIANPPLPSPTLRCSLLYWDYGRVRVCTYLFRRTKERGSQPGTVVHESIILTLRINDIADRDTFVNMFDSESTLKDGAADLGTNLMGGGLPHKREFARVVTAWKTAKVMTETKIQTDAVARAHGVPVTLLPADWSAMMTEFKRNFGSHIPDDRHPAQSCYENFAERLADGTLKAEPLSLIVSAFEEEVQDARKPDTSRQYNLQLDCRLTISTKRRHTSTEPTDVIGLRAKYAIMTNFWPLAQMKQPGRSIYKDFDKSTFIEFLDRLFDRDNFHFYKEVEGRPLIAKWSFCLSYELEIRKEAFKRCEEQAALWGVLGDTEHRMKHWLQLVAIPKGPESFNKQEITDLKKTSCSTGKPTSTFTFSSQAATKGDYGPVIPHPSGFQLHHLRQHHLRRKVEEKVTTTAEKERARSHPEARARAAADQRSSLIL